jgi:hypothetical protein
MEPAAAGLLLPTAPGESPPLVEGPVPLNDVGPPAVPLGLPPCANAKVPDTANTEANTIVVSFMADSLLLGKEDKPLRSTAALMARTTCSSDSLLWEEVLGELRRIK